METIARLLRLRRRHEAVDTSPQEPPGRLNEPSPIFDYLTEIADECYHSCPDDIYAILQQKHPEFQRIFNEGYAVHAEIAHRRRRPLKGDMAPAPKIQKIEGYTVTEKQSISINRDKVVLSSSRRVSDGNGAFYKEEVAITTEDQIVTEVMIRTSPDNKGFRAQYSLTQDRMNPSLVEFMTASKTTRVEFIYQNNI